MTRRELLALALILLAAGAALVVFSTMDRRPPNDHDVLFTDPSLPALSAYEAAESTVERVRVLWGEATVGHRHPPLGATVLVAWLGTVGPSRLAFRLVSLPFLLLLGAGTWLLGRELGGRRVGLLAAVIVLSLPILVMHSRKFRPNFHAAALTPLAWALLLLSLRLQGRAGWAAAFAAGLAQGLRCYAHPVVYPDVVASTVLVVAVAARDWASSRTAARRKALERVLIAAAVAFGVACHIFGLVPGLEEPGYSWARYQAYRPQFLAGSVSIGSLGHAALVWVETLWRTHLLPTGAILWSAAAVALVHRFATEAAGPGRRGASLLLAGVVMQVPLAMLTTARGAYPADWLTLYPSLGVLVAWAVFGGGRATLGGRLFATLATANGAFVLAAPLLLALAGPSRPLDDLEWYRAGLPRWFTRSETGELWNTPHIPIRHAGSLRRLVAAASADGAEVVQEADLTLREPQLRTPCVVRRRAGASWTWGRPTVAGDLHLWSPWPSLFAAHPLELRRHAWPSDWLEPPAAGDRLARSLEASRGPLLVRLWFETRAIPREWLACGISQASAALVESAEGLLGRVLPSYEVLGAIDDLGGEFLGVEDESQRSREYLLVAVYLRPRTVTVADPRPPPPAPDP